MRIWITGGAGSGKSSLAQELAAAVSADGPKYYIATMIPRDDEDRSRIRRHVEDREGMGFVTIECPSGLTRRIAPDPEGTYLLDSVTAMLANAMFGEHEFVYAPEAAQEAAEDLLAFSRKVKNLIAVSDGIFSDSVRYDAMTDQYRRGLAGIQRQAAEAFDTVIECAAGGAQILKGGIPAAMAGGGLFREIGLAGGSAGRQKVDLIIGGAFQGKREYAKSRFRLKEADIYTCTEEEDPDFGAKCIDHLERYFRRCAAGGTEPAPPETFRPDAVLICEDITCGVVPADAADRRWREITGRYWQRLVRRGADVTRGVCGIAQRLRAAPPVIPEEPDARRQVLLLRHGRTRANDEHLYCGRTDLPLCDAGREALRKKAGDYRAFAAEPAACGDSRDAADRPSFYTSGTRRTEETLEILFGAQAAAAGRARPQLREMDFGRFECRSYEQLKDDPAYQEWISGDNDRNLCPGGESGEQMRSRVIAEFYRILRGDPARRIVIVTHGGPIAAIMQELFPEKNFNRYEWQPACGEGYLLKITAAMPEADMTKI